MIDRKIDRPELNLTGRIYGRSPVQGEGTIRGNAFYFRARHDEWTFSVSENAEINPVDIQTIEAGKQHGFYRENGYRPNRMGSVGYMDFEIAEKSMIDCVKEYKNIGYDPLLDSC